MRSLVSCVIVADREERGEFASAKEGRSLSPKLAIQPCQGKRTRA